jgi:hypothetical protein
MPPDVPSLQPLCTLSVTTAITFLGSPFPLYTFGIGIRTFYPISTSVRLAKGLPNVGAVQVGSLDVTLKDVRVKRLQCCVTVDAT